MRIEFFGIDGLNFVEFNITGDDFNFSSLNEESRYVHSEVFNLFAKCFEKSNDLYEYFEPTKYNARKIVVLRNELLAHFKKLNDISSKESFVTFIDNIFLGKAFLAKIEQLDKNWSDHWEQYFTKLKNVNQEMISIVERCIDETRILWVIGY